MRVADRGARAASVAPGLLTQTQTVWEAQARADPLWAVLSEPDKRGRRWAVEDFLATGEDHVAHSLERFECLGGTLPDRDLVVDFGCGVGRLTQPLADRFQTAVGVDISPTMVDVAMRLNSHGSRVRYVVNQEPDLLFIADDSVSLVFTHITLQHVPPDATRRYLAEFARVLKPSGGLIFQLPSHLTAGYVPDDAGDVLPPDPRAARITASELPHEFTAGWVTPIRVSVRNASNHDWVQTAGPPLNVGNHWLDLAGRQVKWDDGRERLPGRLPPQGTAEICLPVVPPTEPGRYRLQVDVVHEDVAWFGNVGGEVLEHVVEVVEGNGTGYGGERFGDLLAHPSEQPPQFEMNGIPISEVTEILERHGMAVLGADEHVTEWHSFVYYVQAAPR